MSGNNAKVLLDLNYPEFQSELFDLDIPEIKKVFKTLKKNQGNDMERRVQRFRPEMGRAQEFFW